MFSLEMFKTFKKSYPEAVELRPFSAENRNVQSIQIFKFVFADLSRFSMKTSNRFYNRKFVFSDLRTFWPNSAIQIADLSRFKLQKIQLFEQKFLKISI